VLRRIFDVAVASADPANVVTQHFPIALRADASSSAREKASAAMAVALDAVWSDVDLTSVG